MASSIELNPKKCNFSHFQSDSSVSWNTRCIVKIKSWEHSCFIQKIPSLFECLDPIGSRAERLLDEMRDGIAPLKKLHDWLAHNEFEQASFNNAVSALVSFLAKLPFRAARNILNMVLNTLRAALYGAVHPVKSIFKLAKMIVRLMKALTLPETWTKLGVGVCGTTLGQAVMGNPLAPIGLIIGIGMMCGGLSVGVLKAYLEKEEGISSSAAMCQELQKQLHQIPEILLTGFFLGLIGGAIERSVKARHDAHVDKNKLEYAEKDAVKQGFKEFEPKQPLDPWDDPIAIIPESNRIERVSIVPIVQKNSIHWTVNKHVVWVNRHGEAMCSEIYKLGSGQVVVPYPINPHMVPAMGLISADL